MEKMTQEQDEISSSTAEGAIYGITIPAVSAGIMEAVNSTYSATALGIKASLGTAISGYGANALAFTGGAVSAFLAGGLIQRNAKTAKIKALGKGMSAVGGVSTIAGTVTALGLAGWPLLLSVFGGSVALVILNSILAGNTSDVEDIISKKLSEEGKKKLEDGVKELEDKKDKIRI